MKNLIIIGARSFGREIYNLSLQCKGYGFEYIIKGFLDDKPQALDAYSNYPSILSSVEEYELDVDDVFICALGDVQYKKKYTELILKKGGSFITLIHPTAIVNPSIKIGEGTIIGQFATVSCDILIGNHVTLHSFCTLGHDVKIGDYCSIGAYAFLGGFVQIEDLVTLHPRSSVIPHKIVKKGAIVGAAALVIRNVPEYVTVFGNPAKIIFSEKLHII